MKDEEVAYLTGFELVKRTPGNGTVTKYKVAVYLGDELVLESDDITVPFEQAVSKVNFDKLQPATKVVLTVLEAKTNAETVNNRMMTLKEFKLLAVDPDLLPESFLVTPKKEEEVVEAVSSNPPVVELPIAEIPVIEAVSQNPPVVELPVAEIPVVEAVSQEPPVVDLPIAEIPVVEVVPTDAPVLDLPILALPEEKAEAATEAKAAPLASPAPASKESKQAELPQTGDSSSLASLLLPASLLALLGLAPRKKND